MSRAQPLPEKNVRTARTIGIRHHADDVKAEATIERQRMVSPASYRSERFRESRVQIDAAERCLRGKIVASSPQRQAASGDQNRLEILDQRSTNAATTPCFVHDDRMQLPHQTIVLTNGADPADDLSVTASRHTTDAIHAY